MSESDLEPLPPPVPQRYRNRADSFRQDSAPPQAKPPQSRRWRWRWFNRSIDNATNPCLGIETSDEEPGPNLKQQSKSWGTSLVIHAFLLFLVTLLVAPANLGNKGAVVVRLRLGEVDETPKTASTPIPISLPPSPPAEPNHNNTEENLPDAEDDVAAVEEDSADLSETKAASVADSVSPVTGSESRSSSKNSLASFQSTPAGELLLDETDTAAAQPRGSFFGISAQGYDFVYILDRSTSMQGRRFQRAKNELLRSVRSLRKDQNFHVFLFGKTTDQLFGDYQRKPRCVPATKSNKARLESWLSKQAAYGNTDPREALHLAFEMNPSAIFMLSDGEFTDDKMSASRIRLRSGTTFELVSDMVHYATSSPPIHAIAYEDPKSRKNMERLASMTGGTSVFVTYRPRSSEQLLADAKKALAQVTGEKRGQLLAGLTFEFAKPSTRTRARRQFAGMLADDAGKSLDLMPLEPNQNHLGSAFQRLLQLDQLRLSDPEHSQRCTELIDRIVGKWKDDSIERLTTRLSQLSQSLKQLDHRTHVQTVMGKVLFDQAAELDAQGDTLDAYSIYKRIVRNCPWTDQAEESLVRCKSIEREIQQGIQDTVDTGKIAKAILDIRKSLSQSKLPEERLMWQNTLTELAFAALAKERDALSARDFTEAKLTQKELENGLETAEQLTKFRQQFGKQESLAQKQLTMTIRSQGRLHPQAREVQLRRVVQDYPHTLAARQAAFYLPDED